MNISATSLALLSDLQTRLSALYPSQVRFSSRVGDHNSDLDSLLNRLSKDKSQLVDTVWLSYYFSRGSLDYIDSRLRQVYWPDPTDPRKSFNVTAIPLATLDITYTLVSNHAPLLEDLEQRISLRHFPLQRSFIATSPVLSGLDPIQFWYDTESPNPNYRVEPTSYGSISELALSLRIYFPMFLLPPASANLITNIHFDIYTLPERMLVVSVSIHP